MSALLLVCVGVSMSGCCKDDGSGYALEEDNSLVESKVGEVVSFDFLKVNRLMCVDGFAFFWSIRFGVFGVVGLIFCGGWSGVFNADSLGFFGGDWLGVFNAGSSDFFGGDWFGAFNAGS